MAMYPEVQRKAQAELDAVIGRDRLPDFDDLDSLPFINAVVKETMRWQPVLPMGESPNEIPSQYQLNTFV
jgi:cytochrome P450